MSEFVWLAVQVLGALLIAGMLYASGLFIVPYLVALRHLRLRVAPGRVSLRLPDAQVMAVLGGVASLVVPQLGRLGSGVFAGGAAIALLLLASSRVAIDATPSGARLTRHVLGLPWAKAHTSEAVSVYLDGWGDFSDPLALHVHVGDAHVELGWFSKGDDADGTLARVEAALATLRT